MTQRKFAKGKGSSGRILISEAADSFISTERKTGRGWDRHGAQRREADGSVLCWLASQRTPA